MQKLLRSWRKLIIIIMGLCALQLTARFCGSKREFSAPGTCPPAVSLGLQEIIQAFRRLYKNLTLFSFQDLCNLHFRKQGKHPSLFISFFNCLQYVVGGKKSQALSLAVPGMSKHPVKVAVLRQPGLSADIRQTGLQVQVISLGRLLQLEPLSGTQAYREKACVPEMRLFFPAVLTRLIKLCGESQLLSLAN